MDILYSSSDSYAFLTGISMLSLMINNRACPEINIYIMDNSISEENKEKMYSICRQERRKLKFVPMPDMKALTGRDIDTRRWNISTFGRLFMASALPTSVHKILNIDCDTIIVDSLQELWEVDLSGKVFGGVLECINDRYRANVGMKKAESYLNGGIVFMNCDEVRKRNVERAFVDFIATYGDTLTYLDQDVLNGVVSEENKLVLPLRYDMLSIYYYAHYAELVKLRRSKNFYSEQEYEDAKKSPVIVHFTACFLDGLRPWVKGNRHPYREEFLKYKEMSPWADRPLDEDNRSLKQKLTGSILRVLPRPLMCEVASMLHGVIIPEKNGRKMKKMTRG